jgi:hypothetical protein
MLPHIDLLRDLSTLDRQDRLRDAVQARIANRAKTGVISLLPDFEPANQRPHSWLARTLLNLLNTPQPTPHPRAHPC